MPFGAIYAALFLAAVASAAGMAGGGVLGEGPVERAALAVAGLACMAGLIARQAWARWAAAVLLAAVAAGAAWVGAPGSTLGGLVLLLGALVGVVLLVVPPTGAFQPAAATGPIGRVLGALSLLGVVAVLTGFGGSPAPDEPEPPPERASAAVAAASAPRPGRLAWDDFGRGLERARSEGRPALVLFVASWCGYCRKMDGTTWRDPEVLSRLGDVVTVRVDAEEQTERHGVSGVELATRYGVRGYPTVVLVDAQGRPLATAGGYLEPRPFLSWLDQALRRAGSAAGAAVQTGF